MGDKTNSSHLRTKGDLRILSIRLQMSQSDFPQAIPAPREFTPNLQATHCKSLLHIPQDFLLRLWTFMMLGTFTEVRRLLTAVS